MTDKWLNDKLPTVKEIRRRLSLIIPGVLDPRGWTHRELAAKTVFVMLYALAVEGLDRWIRPTAVADMTDDQAVRQDAASRRSWLTLVQGRDRPKNVPGRWYSENTRESIRDETLRTLVDLGTVVERPGLPTTSPKPRYALAQAFVELFSPELSEEELGLSVESWQEEHLSATALARLVLERKSAGSGSKKVLVKLPNGETRVLAPGKSSELTREVIEQFTLRFLKEPAAVAISESAQKLTFKDGELSRAIGLTIDVSGTLPDLVLADLGSSPPLIVFVEVVVTDGPVDDRRKLELEHLAASGGYSVNDCAYVTVFRDRADSPYRRMAASLAWGTFVWFATEPDQIVFLRHGRSERASSLSQLLSLA